MLDDCELLDFRVNARRGSAALLCNGPYWFPESNTVLIVATDLRQLDLNFGPQAHPYLARSVLGSELVRRSSLDQLTLPSWEPAGRVVMSAGTIVAIYGSSLDMSPAVDYTSSSDEEIIQAIPTWDSTLDVHGILRAA
jgi:hypothetical protein